MTFTRNSLLAVLGFLLALYWPFAAFLPRGILLEAVNGLVVAMSAGIVTAFFPVVVDMLVRRERQPSTGHVLIFAMVFTQLMIAGLFAWGWAYQYFDKPAWMVDNVFRGWMVYLLFTAGALKLLVADAEEGNLLPTRGQIRLAVIVAAGIAFAVMFLLTVGRIGHVS